MECSSLCVRQSAFVPGARQPGSASEHWPYDLLSAFARRAGAVRPHLSLSRSFAAGLSGLTSVGDLASAGAATLSQRGLPLPRPLLWLLRLLFSLHAHLVLVLQVTCITRTCLDHHPVEEVPRHHLDVGHKCNSLALNESY